MRVKNYLFINFHYISMIIYDIETIAIKRKLGGYLGTEKL